MNKIYNYFYKITNNINNHFYYGVHCTDNLNDGYMGSGTRLKYAYKKYGMENFNKEILKFFDTVKEAYKLLKENSPKYDMNFIGNIEGRDAFSGEIDIVVTDGFTGNVFLKTVEGFGKLVKRSLTENLKKNILSTIASIPALPAIKRFAKTMDYKEYGGALFLGVKKPVVKAHGSSDEKLFYYTIKQAEEFAKNKTVEMMINEFDKINSEK